MDKQTSIKKSRCAYLRAPYKDFELSRLSIEVRDVPLKRTSNSEFSLLRYMYKYNFGGNTDIVLPFKLEAPYKEGERFFTYGVTDSSFEEPWLMEFLGAL